MRVVFSISLISHISLITIIFLGLCSHGGQSDIIPRASLDAEESAKEQIKGLHIIKQLLYYNKHMLRYTELSNPFSLSVSRTHRVQSRPLFETILSKKDESAWHCRYRTTKARASLWASPCVLLLAEIFLISLTFKSRNFPVSMMRWGRPLLEWVCLFDMLCFLHVCVCM